MLLLWTLHLAAMPSACPIVASCLQIEQTPCVIGQRRAPGNRADIIFSSINSSQRLFKAARATFWCLAWMNVPVGEELMPHACFLKQFSSGVTFTQSSSSTWWKWSISMDGLHAFMVVLVVVRNWSLEIDYFKRRLYLLCFFTWCSFNHIHPSSDLRYCLKLLQFTVMLLSLDTSMLHSPMLWTSLKMNVN